MSFSVLDLSYFISIAFFLSCLSLFSLCLPSLPSSSTMSKSRRNVRFQHRDRANSNSETRRLSVSSDVSDAQSESGNANAATAVENTAENKPSTIPEEVG